MARPLFPDTHVHAELHPRRAEQDGLVVGCLLEPHPVGDPSVWGKGEAREDASAAGLELGRDEGRGEEDRESCQQLSPVRATGNRSLELKAIRSGIIHMHQNWK